MTTKAVKARKARNQKISSTFAAVKPGSLHKTLGVPKGTRIPESKLRWAVKHLRGRLQTRAAMALAIHFGHR